MKSHKLHDRDEELTSQALGRFRRGEISAAQYFDQKVDDAMTPLRDLLSDDDYRFVRATLRDLIETDPVLAGLARRLVRPRNVH